VCTGACNFEPKQNEKKYIGAVLSPVVFYHCLLLEKSSLCHFCLIYRSLFWSENAFSEDQLSDEEFLLQCSTSPFAEPPHFVQCQRRLVADFKILCNNVLNQIDKLFSQLLVWWWNCSKLNYFDFLSSDIILTRLILFSCGGRFNRKGRYLIEHLDWGETFPRGKPRVFQRKDDGTWFKCDWSHNILQVLNFSACTVNLLISCLIHVGYL
jgi:Protein N-terminal asparagine amidohydrolase